MRLIGLRPTLVCLLLAGVVSCSKIGGSSPQRQQQVAPPTAGPALCVPVRILIQPDKTLSTDENETPIPLVDEVRPRVEKLLLRCGGEILIGVVREDSNRRLKRQPISAPPEAPIAPSKNVNPLILQTKILPKYEADLRTYQSQHAEWERDSRMTLQSYFDDVRKLLEQKAFATRSDVFGAIARGDSALAEPDAAFGKNCHKYFILVSDGIDNVHKARPVLQSGAKLLLVNGTGNAGSLDSLVAARFESLAAAIQYVLASEGIR